jgi:hypothetical protein
MALPRDGEGLREVLSPAGNPAREYRGADPAPGSLLSGGVLRGLSTLGRVLCDVVFPCGTYLMRVLHGVQCAGAA